MDREQYLRGLLRGFTSDFVGGPADVAEQLANLGIAGYGYAGNKLGLLSPSEMPELLEASPGTSEWFARKAGNPDTKTKEYLAGRLTPLAVGLAKTGSGAFLNRLEELPKAASWGPKAQSGAIDLERIRKAEKAQQPADPDTSSILDAFEGTFYERSLREARAESLDPKSRERLVWMTPDDFHRAALERDPDYMKSMGIEDRRDRIRDALESEEGLADIPQLFINQGSVWGHEGRHRNDVFKELGLTRVPVRLRDAMHRNEAGMFSEVNPTLLSQNGEVIPAPKEVFGASPPKEAPASKSGVVIPQNTWKGLARGHSANDPEKPLHPAFEARIAAEEANLRALEASPVKPRQQYRYGSDGRFPPGVFEVMEPVRQAGDKGYVWAGLIRQRNPDGTFRTAKTELTEEQLLQMGLADLQPAPSPSSAQRFYGGEQSWINNPPAQVRNFGPKGSQRGGIDFGDGPKDEKGLAKFRQDILNRVQRKVAEKQVQTATRDFAFQPGAQFLSQKTGYTYTLTGKSVDSKGRSIYSYEGVHPNGDTQKGTFLEERMLSPEGRASMIPLNQMPADEVSIKGLLKQFQAPRSVTKPPYHLDHVGLDRDVSMLFGADQKWAQKLISGEVAKTLHEAFPRGVPSDVLRAVTNQYQKYWGPTSEAAIKQELLRLRGGK